MDNILNNQKEFDSWHSNRIIDIETDTPWHKFVKQQLQNIDLTSKKILEIGCGRGGFSCWIASNYNNYNELYACDFSRKAIEIGKNYADVNGLSKIIWQYQDIQNLSFEDNYFDILISCETIEHVPNPNIAIKQLHRKCKRNGILILTTPNYFNFYGLFRIYLRIKGKTWTEVGQPINKFVWL